MPGIDKTEDKGNGEEKGVTKVTSIGRVAESHGCLAAVRAGFTARGRPEGDQD